MSDTLYNKLTSYISADAFLQQVYEYTKKRFTEALHLPGHNWEHIYRDTLNAIAIGEAEQSDMTIVLPAIVMHDIGFLYGADGKTHGELGAAKLGEYLAEGGISCSATKTDNIASCIRTHKGSMHNENPESLEAKVVADADLLEKFGVFGVYQGIRTFTEFNYSLQKIIERGESTSTLTMQTKTGARLAEPGRKFVVDFFRQLQTENEKYSAK